MKERGSVEVVAGEVGVHFTTLYAFLAGGALKPENAGKLRALLESVPAEVWADALAPVPEDAS